MEVKLFISDGLQPQLYNFYELIISQQSDPNGKEAICHNNFKIDGGKMGAIGGRESMSSSM